jgi:protein TonB
VCSLVLHVAAVSPAVIAMSGWSVPSHQEPFRWEVTRVQTVQPVVHELSQEIRASTPVGREEATAATRVPRAVHPAQAPQQIVTEALVLGRGVTTRDIVRKGPESVSVETVVQTDGIAAAGSPPVRTPPVPAVVDAAAAPMVEASASHVLVPSGRSAKGDYGRLATKLWQRVTELQRYPAPARMNGWEGRVVLRTVIRRDGQLEHLAIAASSGHAALDEAAKETLRLAFPLTFHSHWLDHPAVVVHVPITYELRE